MKKYTAHPSDLSSYDVIIDVRSPSEYSLDQIPNSINLPVLNDKEREMVGSIYKNHSAFEAKKIGAKLITRNISIHLEKTISDYPRNWRPLVYCWRGGQRSRSLMIVLREVGWNAHILKGGYKAFRKMVREQIQDFCRNLSFCVICGSTGSGKTHILHALKSEGAQIIDLEGIASHKGSLLGSSESEEQSSQKMFESQIWLALKSLSVDNPVFIESESKKIGNLHVPEALIQKMWHSDCVVINIEISGRVKILINDYDHYIKNPKVLIPKLIPLQKTSGKTKVTEWLEMIEKREWHRFIKDILINHYDPAYRKSIQRNYVKLRQAIQINHQDTKSLNFDKIGAKIISLQKKIANTTI